MARTTRNAKLETRSARARLPIGSRVAVKVGAGLSLLYRRGTDGVGTWQGRRWTGTAYTYAALGEADDARASDGFDVLDYFQAFERARAWAREAAQRVPGAPLVVPGRGTVAEALDAYLAEYAKRGGKSYAHTKLAIDRLIRPEVGHLRLDALQTHQVRDFLRALADRGRAVRSGKGKEARRLAPPTDPDKVRARRATANRVYAILRAALNFAYREGFVASDDAWRRVQPFQKVDEARIRFLTAAEGKRLVNACDPELRRLVRAALLTGARFGELARLTVGDFNPDTGRIYIAHGKSGKPRHVPLSVEGQRFFAALATGREAHAPLVARNDGLPWAKNTYVRPLAAASSAAKLEPAVTIHELRHTYASLLAQAGCDLLTISKLLGHADTRITSRHYAHLCDASLAAAVDRLPEFHEDAAAKVVAIA